jgi:hypothetical protein
MLDDLLHFKEDMIFFVVLYFALLFFFSLNSW